MVKKRHHIEEVRFAAGKPLPIEALTLRQLVAKEGAALARPERPTFHLLMRVTEGAGTHVVDFVRHRLRVGAVLHVAPGQVQQFSLDAGLDATLVVFQPDFVRRPPPLLAAPVFASGARAATLEALFEAITGELEQPPRSAPPDASGGVGPTAVVARGRRPDARSSREAPDANGGAEPLVTGVETGRDVALLRALVEALGLALEGEATRDEGAALTRRFRDELELHFARTHEVAAFAAVLRCSTRTLTRHCLRWLGRSPKRVIDERVVLEAKRLLAHGGQPVAAISAALGFAEATQFVKFFRRLSGQTPAAFRHWAQYASSSSPSSRSGSARVRRGDDWSSTS